MKNSVMFAALFVMLALLNFWAQTAAAEHEDGAGCPPAPPDSPAPRRPKGMPLDTNWPKERNVPMRDEVLGLFRRATQLVREQCEAPGVQGTVVVAVEIIGRTGKVRVLNAVGVDRPATVTCVTKIVSSLRFRPFERELVKLKYPFKLHGQGASAPALDQRKKPE